MSLKITDNGYDTQLVKAKMDNMQQYFDTALEFIKDAGKELKGVKNIVPESKEEDWDLVTKYDRKIEEILIRRLKKEFPNHNFIGEEKSSKDGIIPELTNKPTWIIDPIDGTANFTRFNPITAISVGLVIEKEPVMGIIYNPFMEELYSAIKGEGAYFNGERVFTSGLKEIGKCCFTYELSLAKNPKLFDLYLYRYKHLMPIIQGIRSFGCAVMSLCYVACGRIDCYQCDGLYPWDVAAGAIIVREAGGYICSSNGEKLDLMNPNFIAGATEILVDQFVEIEKLADAERISNTKK